MTVSLLVHNAHRLDARGMRDLGWLYAAADGIRAVGLGPTWQEHLEQAGEAADDETVVVDAQGGPVVPGFIDLHAHGGAGHRFEEGRAAMVAGLAVHRRHGTTGSVLSLASTDLNSLERSLADIAELAQHDPLVLGSHLEGPYLSPRRRGAHDAEALRLPVAAEIRGLMDAAQGTLRQVTLAPELPGAMDAIGLLTARDVVVAVGHTEADYAQARAGFDAGATLLTHAYNAMPGISHRAPGPVVAAFDDERVCLEVINDGHHVDSRIVAFTFGAAPGRVAMVSDAMAATGMGDGVYRLGRSGVTVTDGVARVTETGQLAGATVTLDAALRRAIAAGVDPVTAVAAVTSVPAAVLGLDDRIGRLDVGYAAHLVVLDLDWQVTRVFAAGEEIPR